ncbi:MAG: restriction endonuclease subunit R [Synechococcales bacterium]|nr:restriction endonuclease subunit R [Synechococcales bacterium]
MVQVLQAKEVGLNRLRECFGLQWVRDRAFFAEWYEALPTLSDREISFLDCIQEGYFAQLQQEPPLSERVVQLTVVSPLLCLAGLYLPPFEVRAERSIEISDQDDGVLIKGTLDILLVRDRFWVMVIESKRAEYSVEAGLGQLLAYLLAMPQPQSLCYGLLASGSDFIFVKLKQEEAGWQYSTSDQFAMRRSGDIYEVFRILKRLTTMK